MKKQPAPPPYPSKPNHSSRIGKKEWRRLCALTSFEREAREQGFSCVAGVDEAGRGPLAGPVLAAACIIPVDTYFPGIDDSKKLIPQKREALYQEITAQENVIFAIGIISHEEIDLVNIYQATILAMLQAIAALKIMPDRLLVDGLNLPHPSITAQKIIQGDALSQSIAAASILAKVTRDRMMIDYHEQYPQYGFNQHKGYSTQAHLEALTKYGPCPIHRKSFEPVRSLMSEAGAEQLDLFEAVGK